MIILIESVILLSIVLLLIYYFYWKTNEDLSIPYATYGSYPIVGHLFGFIRDRTKLLIECRQRYGSFFRIKLVNQRFIMISSHIDWMKIVKNSAFQFMGIELGIKIFGFSSIIQHHSELDVETHRLYIQHLKNRDGLHPMVVEFVRRMRNLMKTGKESFENNHSTSKWTSTGLLELSHRMLFQPSTLALFGDINTSVLEKHFRLFDDKFHYFYLPLPQWFYSGFLSKESNARSQLSQSWQYNLDPTNASMFYQDRLELYANHSEWLSDEESGKYKTAFFWASLGNTIPGVFWSLFYILRDPKALVTIQEEINTHLPFIPLDNTDSQSAYWTPEQLDSCIYLESAINETIRLVGAIFMTRKCCRDTQITLEDGHKINIKAGEDLAWYGGASHIDENLFPHATQFIFDRFLNKKVETVPGYMPFGGGKSICPGRFFVRYEIKTCVAMLLRYMEYKLDDIQTIPNQKLSRIGVGIAPPNHDIPIMYRYKI
ncbi:hypothetical protein I4U23_003810 [Adineta vaga]|nr:hypothetical protein I4U23_003810 [Adineta vaga]